MERSIFFKPKLPPLLALTLLIVVAGQSAAQSVNRQSISPIGSSLREGTLYLSSTVGQPYHTAGGVSQGMTIRPGFQQSPRIRFDHSETRELHALSLAYYPNPAQDQIVLESKDELTQVRIRILDHQGRMINEQKLARMRQHQIDCSRWLPGNYLLAIEDSAGKKQTIKINIVN